MVREIDIYYLILMPQKHNFLVLLQGMQSSFCLGGMTDLHTLNVMERKEGKQNKSL